MSRKRLQGGGGDKIPASRSAYALVVLIAGITAGVCLGAGLGLSMGNLMTGIGVGLAVGGGAGGVWAFLLYGGDI